MSRSSSHASYCVRRHWSVDDARAALADQAESGLSMGEFAERTRLDVQRLYRWKRRLDRASAPPSRPQFVEVTPQPAAMVEVVLLTGRVMRVSETVDPTVLTRLVEALERGAPC
jgi:hypothetical protein